ncbi:complement regulator-acquiring protein [Borrelia sp. RT1S]|uniref:complement regulator-acquiring protein n=1 Tax=Borrelia sp. RT1S TaxID=2898580 RepID=UPI002106FEB9|nr:complement regulator-acquiring protein [Borrelia sp. RT1S]UGQ17974.2 complement regulator-acquiring protein [Borrelia sp. RT1S]
MKVKTTKRRVEVKKISIMFLLVLALSFVSCSQAETGDGKQQTEDKKTVEAGSTSPRQTGASQEVSDEEMADEEKQARAEQLAAATTEAFKILKDKRDEYSSKINTAKAAYDALGTAPLRTQDKVEIPGGITDFTKAKDQPKFHASLGYDNKTIENLNKSIDGLSHDGKIDDLGRKTTVNGIFNLLVSLEDATKKILDTHLSDENLKKIENNKDKIEKATAELKEFITSRDDFIAGIKKSIEASVDQKATSDDAKAELDKIIAKTSSTSSTKAGDAGYLHSKVEAVKNNEKVLSGLFN